MAEFNKRNNHNNNNKKDYRNNDNFYDKDFNDNNYRKPKAKKPVYQRSANPVKRPKGIDAPDNTAEVIEYKMSAALAETILKSDKTKRTPQEVLCEYVNTQCGLKGFCVRVSYF